MPRCLPSLLCLTVVSAVPSQPPTSHHLRRHPALHPGVPREALGQPCWWVVWVALPALSAPCVDAAARSPGCLYGCTTRCMWQQQLHRQLIQQCHGACRWHCSAGNATGASATSGAAQGGAEEQQYVGEPGCGPPSGRYTWGLLVSFASKGCEGAVAPGRCVIHACGCMGQCRCSQTETSATARTRTRRSARTSPPGWSPL